MADIGTRDRKYLRAMDRAHHLTAPRVYAIVQQEAKETNAFVAQRIALVDTDHRGRKAFYVFGGGERWPRQRVVIAKGLEAVGHGAAVVMIIDQDAIVLDRGRIFLLRPLTCDVRA